MTLHYIKIATRNLAKQKVLAFINVFGLSVGIACFSLFLLYAINEFSYERFHKNAGRIFRVDEVWDNPEGKQNGIAGLYMPLGPAMKKDFPDVENFVRFNAQPEYLINVNGKNFHVSVTFADPQVLSVFSFKLLSGNPAEALKKPNQIVITRDAALRLFGDINSIGKTVEIKSHDKFQSFIVSAIAENIPSASSIKFDILASYEYLIASRAENDGINSWHTTYGDETFVQLKKGSHLNNEPDRLLKFRFAYYPDEAAAYKKDKKVSTRFILQPLRTIHLTPNIDSGPPGSSTDPKNIWILISIASGILLIACINFTTLAIGRSAGRAKEVGVRKVVGGRKIQLAYQFLTESMLLSIVSAIIGMLLANILLPFFNRICGRQMQFSITQFPELVWLLVTLTIIVGLLAGSYPALVLSAFKPVDVLKSKIKLGGSNIFTKSLVTLQFVLSIALIISTLIIFQQLHFMRSKNLGFKKENVVVVHAEDNGALKIYPLFRQAVQSSKEIMGTAGAFISFGEGMGEMGYGFTFKSKDIGAIIYPVDHDFLNVLGLRLLAGRNFDPTIASDTSNAIIANETFVKNELGMTPAQAIGVQIKQKEDGNNRSITIIGVTNDFNFEPLTGPVRPQVFNMTGATFEPHQFFVRLRPGDPAPALQFLQKTWSSLVPDLDFHYSFLDEDLDRYYKSEEKWVKIVGWAGGISIMLACLGLFGLAALATINRTKEIGIRKVLGAPVSAIVQLLSKDFLQLVIIALLIASPIAWYFMHKWLQDYVYRIDIDWWIFALTGIVALLIALLTVGIHAFKAAMSNPVKSLRTE